MREAFIARQAPPARLFEKARLFSGVKFFLLRF
jgi:hypothetical protein